MSLKPLLSSLTGRLTEEARQHVREEGARYQRWFTAACRDGVVPCPTCHTRLDQPASWPCVECGPYRSGANQSHPSHKPTKRRR